MGRLLVSGLVWIAAIHAMIAAPANAQGETYTVNGSVVAPEMGLLLAHYGFAPGAYYIDANGNYGQSGNPPQGNFDGGPVRGWSGSEPTTVTGNPYAEAYVNGVTGVRIFWVYSPSIVSDVKGGSSGYYHICPGNVYYATSEGSVGMSDRYSGNQNDTQTSVGVAGTSRSAGRWAIEAGAQGPELVGYAPDGGVQRVPLVTMLQGSWTVNRTKYVVEPGKASC